MAGLNKGAKEGITWIEFLRLHIGYFGCMMLVGSDPWLSENKANQVMMESRFLFDQ